jgi:hypothetical protein
VAVLENSNVYFTWNFEVEGVMHWLV